MQAVSILVDKVFNSSGLLHMISIVQVLHNGLLCDRRHCVAVMLHMQLHFERSKHNHNFPYT